MFAAIDSAVAEANEAADDFKSEAPLAISKGFSSYLKGKDSSVQDVFRRADKAMYDDKTAYYKAHDRRQR
jgi:GGDEF domain-containing protein